MTEELYIGAIAALLPLTACMVVTQVNPYHALVIRGILGAVAALVYALFGAADVALTEALVGTMLSITLYAVAVRSSLSMRLGVLEGTLNTESTPIQSPASLPLAQTLLSTLRQPLSKYHLRLELVPYSTLQDLQTALVMKDVHTIVLSEQAITEDVPPSLPADQHPPYVLQTRVQRLYDIMRPELPPTLATLTYFQPGDTDQLSTEPSNIGRSDPMEVHL